MTTITTNTTPENNTQTNQHAPTDKIIPALFAAMAAIKKAEADGYNSFKNANYPTLGAVVTACRDALHANGLFIMQTPFSNPEAGTVSVCTRLIHAESGQTLTCGEDLAVGVASFDAQTVGGAITYLRRYTLAAMLGIVTDQDDDGHRASQNRGNRNQGNQSHQSRQQQARQPQGQHQHQGQNSPRNAPNAPAQGKPAPKPETPQGDGAAPQAKPNFTAFWQRQRELRVAQADAAAMVQDYLKGEHGMPGTPEADASLIKSLEALAAERRPKAA